MKTERNTKMKNVNSNNKKEILVVEGGWVFIADAVDTSNENTDLLLENASVIRVWGTTKGLGEIAVSGPTKKTILDYCGNPTVPVSKVLFRIPCTFEG